MVNYIILYKKIVEHHVIKLILLKILDIFNKINLITWCSTNFLYKMVLQPVNSLLISLIFLIFSTSFIDVFVALTWNILEKDLLQNAKSFRLCLT